MEIFKSSYFELDASWLNDSEMTGILSNNVDAFFKIELNLANFDFFDSSQNQNDFNQLQMAIIEIIRKLFLEIHPFFRECSFP